MKNKRICLALTIAVIVIIALSAVSCNKTTPYKLWSDAIKDIKNADSISADIEITYGGDSYIISANHDIANSSRALEIKFSEDDIMKVISDGRTNYYENAGLTYSSSNISDNPVMKELLSFTLRDAETLGFSKDFFANSEFENGDKTTLKVIASGSDIKNALAPDEDLEFSEKITLSAEFDSNTYALVSVTIDGEIGGKEFYGLPLCKSGNSGEKTAFTAKITNISYSDKTISLLPEKTSEYPDLPALAQLNASARLMALKKETKTEIGGQIEVSMGALGLNIKMPLSGTITAAYNEGFITTRTKMKLEMALMGTSETETIDTFTDGKSDYIYYTGESAEDCYKILSEKSENDDSLSSMTELLSNPSNLQKYFKNSTMSKSGKDTIISVELTAEQIEELMNSMNSGSDGDDISSDFGSKLDGMEMSDSSMKIKITVNENGIITKSSIDFSASASIGDGENDNPLLSSATMKISLSVNAEFSDIYEDITPDIPQGYENYPEKSTDN